MGLHRRLACGVQVSDRPLTKVRHLVERLAFVVPGIRGVCGRVRQRGRRNVLPHGRSLFHEATHAVTGRSDVSATWIAGPINPAAPPPPPTSAPKDAGYALPRAAACQTRPPIHRYGDFQHAPFAGGVLADANTVAPWPATWRTAQNASGPAAANAYPTLGALNTYYTNGAYVDAGPVNLTGTGLTVGLLFSNTAMVGDGHACTPAASVTPVPEGMPSQWALFDIGGYSVYSQVSQCTPGFTNGIMNAATYVTSADGTSTVLQGAATPRSPLLPAVNERYTWVTFGSNGARIYVNGVLWGVAPGVGYTTAGVFSAQWARFYFGDMHGGGQGPMTITLHDLQVYDRELQPGEVASLTRGIGYVSGKNLLIFP